MWRTPDVTVIVPAYNEQARLEPTLRSTVEYFRACHREVEVLVVDDGSRDETSAVVRRVALGLPEVRLIRLAENQGKGYAVRSGVVNATGAYVLYLDADGATPIAEIARLERALAAGAALAIGSRALRASDVHVHRRWYRHVVGRTFHALVRLLAVRGIADTQCGFKMLRAGVAQDLFSRIRMNGFSFDVELLLNAQRLGYAIAEVPVNWEHKPGSRVSLMLDSIRMARDLLLIRWHVLRGDYDRPHVAPSQAGVPHLTLAPIATGVPEEIT